MQLPRWPRPMWLRFGRRKSVRLCGVQGYTWCITDDQAAWFFPMTPALRNRISTTLLASKTWETWGCNSFETTAAWTQALVTLGWLPILIMAGYPSQGIRHDEVQVLVKDSRSLSSCLALKELFVHNLTRTGSCSKSLTHWFFCILQNAAS